MNQYTKPLKKWSKEIKSNNNCYCKVKRGKTIQEEKKIFHILDVPILFSLSVCKHGKYLQMGFIAALFKQLLTR